MKTTVQAWWGRSPITSWESPINMHKHLQITAGGNSVAMLNLVIGDPVWLKMSPHDFIELKFKNFPPVENSNRKKFKKSFLNHKLLISSCSDIILFYQNWTLKRKLSAILKSQRLAQEQAITNTNLIHHWFKPIVPKKLIQAKQWCRDKLCLSLLIRRKATNNLSNHHKPQQLIFPSSTIFLSSKKINWYPTPLTSGCGLFLMLLPLCDYGLILLAPIKKYYSNIPWQKLKYNILLFLFYQNLNPFQFSICSMAKANMLLSSSENYSFHKNYAQFCLFWTKSWTKLAYGFSS